MWTGDWNARVQIAQEGEEENVGNHTFNSNNITLDKKSDDVIENRNNLITFVQKNKFILANFFF